MTSHSPPTTLLLIRHAETEDNVAARLSGWTDTDLTPLGEQQVELVADHVNLAHAHAVALYSSPLKRARRTAEAIGRLTGHSPIVLEDLREMHFGSLDGQSIELLRRDWSHLLFADEDETIEDFTWPEGESRSGFAARVKEVMSRIAATHPGQPVCVVTHGGLIATLLTIIHGESPARWRKWIVANASLTEVEWDPATETGHLLRHDVADHLEALTAEETGNRH